jgi:hypothetical protein
MNDHRKVQERKRTSVSVTLTMLALGLTGIPALAQGPDSLYVGDAGDNTVKRFEVKPITGNGFPGFPFQGAFVKRSVGGLKGPRGLIFDSAGELLVSDQNVDTAANGDILQYSLDGKPTGRPIVPNGPSAPAVPRGMILVNNSLFVAELVGNSAMNATDPGRLLKYSTTGNLIGAFSPGLGVLAFGAFHPRAVVQGPDHLLYVSNFTNLPVRTGGHVLRFHPDTGEFSVFITSTGGSTCGCTNELNRPDGLAFGPDGNLYITSFQGGSADTDKILIFQGPGHPDPGAYMGRIDLGQPGRRAFAQALLFGPGGRLFVPISGGEMDTGAVRAYNVSTKVFDYVAPPGGPLAAPWYLTFGKTDPGTLAYPAPPPPLQLGAN